MQPTRLAASFLSLWLALPPAWAQNATSARVSVPAPAGPSAAAVGAASAQLRAPTLFPQALQATPAGVVLPSPPRADMPARGTAREENGRAAAAAALSKDLALALPKAAAPPAASPAASLSPVAARWGGATASGGPAAAESGASAKTGALGALRSLAPGLAGKDLASILDRFFTGAAPGSSLATSVQSGRAAVLLSRRPPRGHIRAGGGRAAEPAAPGLSTADRAIEDFARAGAQAFYDGRLRPGEHGAVVAAPRKALPAGELPDEGELRRRMELPTLTNPQREEKAIELLQLGGAAKEVVTLKPGEKPAFDRFHTIFRQDAGRGRHNLFVVKPGRRADKVIVVGAHHDKVSVGEGKIDNWSGTTLVANLYQAMKDVDTEATYVFILFSREEEGLIGSDVFVRSLAPEARGRIRAMVNVDTVGVDGTFSWRNNSSRYLLDAVARVAQEKAFDLKEISFSGGDADSSSFKRFTHAMTLFGASPDVIFDIIHSRNDHMGAFSMPHYVNAVKLTLALLYALDREDPPRPVAPLVAEESPRGPPAGRIAYLTPASKAAVLLQLEREAGTLHIHQYEYLRRTLLKAFGGDI